MAAVDARASEPRHGLSVFGELKYAPDFAHFEYANPEAPQGGTLRIPVPRTFDSLHPFIRKGRAAAGVETYIYETLLTRAYDEPSALYGLLAETVELADDKSWIEFTIRPEARWHDGIPVTPDDVVFTVEVLKEKGSPKEKTLLLAVVGAEKRGPRTVRIRMSGRATRQLPLQVSSEMQILPKHYWETREFDETTLEIPLGSGAYRIARLVAGRSITYERVPDFWGNGLNVNVGRFNFERIRFKYFQDISVQLEAVKGHAVDWNVEGVSKVWATGYDTPARRRGHFIQEFVETERPILNRLRVFNLRREKFRDRRVREALMWAYDHEWKNNVLTYQEYKRSRSYFENSDMEHKGPPSPEERALLEPFRDELDPRLFERQWDPPVSPGHGRNRDNMRIADRLLQEAGWIVRDGVRVNAETGEPFVIELLLSVPEWTRTSLAYADSLKQLGIKMRMRSPYTAEYRNLVLVERDFDLVYTLFRLKLVPGAELRNRLGSQAAARKYSFNVAGIKSPAVDFLIETIISAESRAELITAASALDRVLCWGFYTVSVGHTPGSRYAYWNVFGRPETPPRFATGFPHTWWIDPVKERMVAEGTPIEVHQAAVR